MKKISSQLLARINSQVLHRISYEVWLLWFRLFDKTKNLNLISDQINAAALRHA